MRKILLLAGGLLLALAACGQSPASVAPAPDLPPTRVPSPQQAAPTSVPATTQPSAQPATSVPATTQPSAQPATSAPATAQPSAQPAALGSGGGLSVRPPDELVLAAQRQLAAYLKLDPSAIELQSANRRDWPDGALGCPKPDTAYPQMVVPGFLLVFTNQGQAQSYPVHTSLDAKQMVLCANSQPVDLALAGQPAPGGGAAAALDQAGQRALALAQAGLARELAIQPGDVLLLAAEQVEWNDSSLGCPKPDRSYLQVITPGYKLTLQAQGKTYEYHTDLGKRAVRCGR